MQTRITGPDIRYPDHPTIQASMVWPHVDLDDADISQIPNVRFGSDADSRHVATSSDSQHVSHGWPKSAMSEFSL
jgi:hypothetical protein